ncbi:MAG: sigma-54 dependent transcriptional regulator, partial [Planctomycetota bacterium]
KTQVTARFKIDRIVGNTERMRELFSIIETIGPSDATVLITGESGTGKELAAQALHRHSPRAARPLIKVSCAALPESLLEDELFGHERGAFTDAKERKPGRFELADGGSIFLDDIDDLPLQTQVKLLRVLQEREFERLGGTKTLKLDVRVITACKVDLGLLVQQGRIREDLYYRLRVVELRLPPLRERLADVPLLTQHFIRMHGGERQYHVAPETVLRMCQYEWPGNVRELENAVLRAIAMAGGSELLGEEHLLLAPAGLHAPPRALKAPETPQNAPDLPAPQPPAAPPETQSGVGESRFRPLREIVGDAEREYVKRALEAAGGSRTRAAALLDISRKNLWEKMRDFGMQ